MTGEYHVMRVPGAGLNVTRQPATHAALGAFPLGVVSRTSCSKGRSVWAFRIAGDPGWIDVRRSRRGAVEALADAVRTRLRSYLLALDEDHDVTIALGPGALTPDEVLALGRAAMWSGRTRIAEMGERLFRLGTLGCSADELALVRDAVREDLDDEGRWPDPIVAVLGSFGPGHALFAESGEAGGGVPLWGKMSEERQRWCVLLQLCQICGRPDARILVVMLDGMLPRASLFPCCTHEPMIHAACVPAALRCPRIRQALAEEACFFVAPRRVQIGAQMVGSDPAPVDEITVAVNTALHAAEVPRAIGFLTMLVRDGVLLDQAAARVDGPRGTVRPTLEAAS